MEEGVLLTRSVRAAILTMEGTNNEEEAFRSFKLSGAQPDIVHLKQLENRIKKMDDYDILFFPGGFSAGDYVRAGAVMAARVKARLMKDLKNFAERGNPVMGSCNGFQVLIELGLIPNVGRKFSVEAALAPNISNRFEARTVYLRIEKRNCIFLRDFEDGEVIKLPIAHSEGRFVPSDQHILKSILKHKLNVVTYVNAEGKVANYPWNPNGSVSSIAGLCNNSGNVLGMMPHPERAFDRYTGSDWTREKERDGMGHRFFKNAVEFVREKY